MKSGRKTRFSPASFFILGKPIVFVAIAITLSDHIDRRTIQKNRINAIELRQLLFFYQFTINDFFHTCDGFSRLPAGLNRSSPRERLLQFLADRLDLFLQHYAGEG